MSHIGRLSRLTDRRRTGRVLSMSTHKTRNIAPATVGIVVHRVVADLLGHSRAPSATDVKEAVRLRTQDVGDRSHLRAVRQRVFGLVSLYFWHLALDPSWKFVGAELGLGTGHIDLTFEQAGRILLDEVKSGIDSRIVLGRATNEQTDRYVRDGRELHGELFVGVRVLALADPGRSLLKTDTGVSQLLLETPYHPWRNN